MPGHKGALDGAAVGAGDRLFGDCCCRTGHDAGSYPNNASVSSESTPPKPDPEPGPAARAGTVAGSGARTAATRAPDRFDRAASIRSVTGGVDP